MNNSNDPFDALKQLGQLRQFQKMFGSDFFKNLPMPDMGANQFRMPFFGDSEDSFPKADIYEQGSEVVAVLELPGLRKSTDVALSVRPNKLIVSGLIPKIGAMEDRVIQQERHHGSFQREISLPVSVVPDRVRAAYKNGLLTVFMVKEDSNSETPKNTIPIDFA